MSEPLDGRALVDLLVAVGDDEAFVGEVVDTFLVDAPDQLDAMAAAVATSNAEALVRPAHTLKGNSLNLGATDLAERCRSLEERGRRGSLDGAVEDVEAARAELERVRAALDDARARGWRS
jgi:HPt (histidine-containing phosphotransfer) domain-containing protein